MQVQLRYQTLRATLAKQKTKHPKGENWLAAGNSRAWKYDSVEDVWELMTPEARKEWDGKRNKTIAVKDRIFKPMGLRLFRDRIEWTPSKSNLPWGIMPGIDMLPTPATMDGRKARYAKRKQHRYWEWENIAVVAGRGPLIVHHDGNGLLKKFGFEQSARTRVINKEIWLEKRRMRATAEKSLKVINKLGSVAAVDLPLDFKFDIEKDAEAYQRLLESLHPDCPSVSEVDMKRFGQCVLWAARQRSWYFQLPPGNPYRREPDADDLARAFDSMRARLRTQGYKTDNVYSWSDDTEYPREAVITHE